MLFLGMSEKMKKSVKVFYCRKNDRHAAEVWQSEHYFEKDGEVLCVCPFCDAEVAEVSYRYLNVYKGWQNSTGPKTQAGKNRSKLNGWKHGANSKTYQLLAPAKPGQYPVCDGCEFKAPCENDPYSYCPVWVAPLMEVIRAYKEGDLTSLKEIAGFQAGQTFMVLQMMFQNVIQEGVSQPRVVKTNFNKAGDEKTEVLDLQANPLLKEIPKYVEMLGMNANQQNMTPDTQQTHDELAGHLKVAEGTAVDIKKYLQGRTDSIQNLQKAILKANVERSGDNALNEHKSMEALNSGEPDSTTK